MHHFAYLVHHFISASLVSWLLSVCLERSLGRRLVGARTVYHWLNGKYDNYGNSYFSEMVLIHGTALDYNNL